MTEVQTQEELAALFSRHLSLNPHVEKMAPYVESFQNVDPPSYKTIIENPLSYQISQHYNHSSHLAKFQQARETDQLTAEIILSRNGVDIATLTPAQLALFKSAEVAQQMRLIELWKITPSYGGHAVTPNLQTWQTTSFEQEEASAKMRHERKMLEQQQQTQVQLQDQYARLEDRTGMEQNKLTSMQGGDGRWCGSDFPQTIDESEPYMQSGYEQLAQREYEASMQQQSDLDIYSHFGTATGGQAYNHSTDPVFNIMPNSGPHWEKRQQQAMEHQYGAFQYSQYAGIGTRDFGVSEDTEML